LHRPSSVALVRAVFVLVVVSFESFRFSPLLHVLSSMKFLKAGKVVVVLRGRYAGRKAVIVRPFDQGTKSRGYGFCLVAGIDRYPRKLIKGMKKRVIKRRSTLKPFLKSVNYTHIMPTRYTLDCDLRKVGRFDVALDPGAKKKALRTVRRVFTEKYLNGSKKWFFVKLRF